MNGRSGTVFRVVLTSIEKSFCFVRVQRLQIWRHSGPLSLSLHIYTHPFSTKIRLLFSCKWYERNAWRKVTNSPDRLLNIKILKRDVQHWVRTVNTFLRMDSIEIYICIRQSSSIRIHSAVCTTMTGCGMRRTSNVFNIILSKIIDAVRPRPIHLHSRRWEKEKKRMKKENEIDEHVTVVYSISFLSHFRRRQILKAHQQYTCIPRSSLCSSLLLSYTHLGNGWAARQLSSAQHSARTHTHSQSQRA